MNTINFKYTRNKTIKASRLIIFFSVFVSCFLSPAFLFGQEPLTPAEFEKFQQIRDSLIQRGFIQEQSEISAAKAPGDASLIEYSSYTGNNKTVETAGARSNDFKPDGSRFYVLGRDSENVLEYHLSNDWDIESASFERELDISSELGSRAVGGSFGNGLYIRKTDGKRLWVFNRQEIWEYTLSTAWDVSTARQTGYKDLSDVVVRGHDFDFRPDGRVLYVDDRIHGSVFQFDLSSAWNVESASLDKVLDISDQQEEVRGIQFSPDGDRMFLNDTGRQEVLEYFLTNPYEVNSADFVGSYPVDNQIEFPEGISFKPDGSMFYVTSTGEEKIYQYRVSALDDGESTVESDKEKVIANGSAEGIITVTARTPDGERIAGVRINLSSSSDDADINRTSINTNSSGQAHFDVSNSKAETVTFTASGMGTTIDQTASLRFVNLDAGESSITSNREKVIANGSSEIEIAVTARDQDGDPLEDVPITLNANSGNVDINDNTQDTNSNGVAFFDVSNEVAESVTFTASGMGKTIDQEVTVRFVTVDPDESSIASSRNKVQANGIESSVITVVARDEDGDELDGLDISLQQNGGNSEIDGLQKVTDEDGIAEFRVTNKTAEVVEYQANGLGVTIGDEVSVSFIPIDPDESDISISTQKILANGSAEATITITARDEDGDPFSNTNITLNQDGGSSDITSVQKTTDDDGIAIFKVKNNNVEEITYSASALGVTINQTVTARFVTVDLDESTIAVNPENVQADGEEESRIIVTTRDEDGDVLHGARVILEALNGNSSIGDPEKTTGSDGTAEFTVSNNTPQIVNYQVTAEGIEFPEEISVGFIPIAPVALSASDVQTRQFNANWEVVQGAEYYVIDVSTDSSFTNFVEPYNAYDVGNTTSFTVENVDPGTSYMYRVRAVSDGLTGANSQLIQTTTFPEVPEAVAATERNALKFTANWQEAAGARKYRLDVSTDASFNNILSDYNNLDVGSDLNFTVTNLEPGTSYYYRLRSEAGPRTSVASNVIETSTLTISSEQSDVSSNQLRVLANGEQSNEIRIVVKSDEGILLEGLEVELSQENDNSDIEPKQPITDEEGVAIFGVSSTSAGTASYTATVAGRLVGEISVEFLADEGVLRIGNNYPNPFRSQTILPLTVPESMMIEIQVYNSIGVPVKTVVKEEMNEGYYEVSFSADDLASGVYFYRLITEDDIMTRKMVLIK